MMFVKLKSTICIIILFFVLPAGLFSQQQQGSDTVLRAWADLGGRLSFFPDLNRINQNRDDHDRIYLPISGSFPALVWSENSAGSYSEPRAEFLDISLVRIDNPISGEWLNPQMLIIGGIFGESIYWTDDGTDPLRPNGTGRLYQGPVRIEKRGNVSLRIAWRSQGGVVREERLEYYVSPDTVLNSDLEHFHVIEGQVLVSPLVLSVPDSYLWSTGGIPNLTIDEITLRPEQLTRRSAAIHFSGGDYPGIYRFVFSLDGRETGTFNPGYSVPEPVTGVIESISGERLLIPFPSSVDGVVYSEPPNAHPPLRLLSAGMSRLILWPGIHGNERLGTRTLGTIFFSWGGAWFRGDSPLLVPLEGGTLHWIVFDDVPNNEDDFNGLYADGISYSGPYSVRIEALPGASINSFLPVETTRGRIAYQYSNEGLTQSWEYVSDVLVYYSGIITDRNMDVSDGEDLVWAFISMGGQILEMDRRNRIPPPAPELTGLPAGDWTREAVNLELTTTEEDFSGFINARLVYSSGAVEEYSGLDSLVISSYLNELAQVYVEAYQVDSFGNHGLPAWGYFILDPNTVYVSPSPLMEPANPEAPIGGMDNPFTSLEEAIYFALENDIGEIRVAGTHELKNPITVHRDLRIDGNWRSASRGDRAVLLVSEDFYWDLETRVNLNLTGIRVQHNLGNDIILKADRGVLEINDSEIIVNTQELKTPLISASNSRIYINNSSVEIEGDNVFLFDIHRGSIILQSTVFLALGDGTVSIFDLRDSIGTISISFVSVEGPSITIPIDAEIHFISGEILAATSRVTNVQLLEDSVVLISNSMLEIEGVFSARSER